MKVSSWHLLSPLKHSSMSMHSSVVSLTTKPGKHSHSKLPTVFWQCASNEQSCVLSLHSFISSQSVRWNHDNCEKILKNYAIPHACAITSKAVLTSAIKPTKRIDTVRVYWTVVIIRFSTLINVVTECSSIARIVVVALTCEWPDGIATYCCALIVFIVVVAIMTIARSFNRVKQEI